MKMSDLGAAHSFSVRVYYEDTDAGGVVYHSNYLRFAERARTEMLRSLGVDHQTMLEENGLMFAVRRCEVDYIKPAILDDLLEIRSRFLKLTGASILIEQSVQCLGQTLVDLQLLMVCIKPDGRPGRVPSIFKSILPRTTGSEMQQFGKNRA